MEQGKLLKDTIAAVESELVVVEGSLQREGQRLPNLSHPQVCHKQRFAPIAMWHVCSIA